MADIVSSLPVTDTADGLDGSSAPVSAQQVGGLDGSGNLQAMKVDTSGRPNIVIDGATDNTLIGNLTDRLKVIPIVLTSKTRIVVLTTPITIAASGYTTVYTYSGSGLFIGFNLEFNNTAVIVKFQVDGETVLDGASLATLNGLLATTNNAARYQNGSGLVTASSTIDFSFREPIRYASSITISANANSGLIPRTFSQGIVYITEET